jgi:hypothetical protein
MPENGEGRMIVLRAFPVLGAATCRRSRLDVLAHLKCYAAMLKLKMIIRARTVVTMDGR